MGRLARAAAPASAQSEIAKIELAGVAFRVGDGAGARTIIDGVSLSVAEGELVAVMGPSGSGKSTLLSLVGGLITPTAGVVRVDGHDVGAMAHDERARLRLTRLGYVFQELNLVAALTVGENVSLPLELSGVRARDARRQVQEALDRAGLADRVGAYPDDLSGGERQRVAIARATIGGSRLLLADEPTGALDSVNGHAIASLLRETATAGLLVTHDESIAAYADRVVRMQDGRLQPPGDGAAGLLPAIATGA